MAFPTTPTDGQLASVNGISYVYNLATNSWSRRQLSLPTLSMTVDTFTGDGNTVSFSLSTTPYAKEFVAINIDGVLQQKAAYSLLNSVITFTGTPIFGSIIEVKTITAPPTSVLTGLVFDSFTGDSTTTAFTLSTAPTNKNYTIVTVGGVVQQKVNYNVVTTVLTFTTAPPLNAPIEITTFGPAISSSLAAGANTQIQFNSSNSLASSSNLTFNNDTNTLNASNITANGIPVLTAVKSMAMTIVFGG